MKEKNSKKVLILTIIIIVIVLAIVLISAIYFSGKDKKVDKENNTTSEIKENGIIEDEIEYKTFKISDSKYEVNKEVGFTTIYFTIKNTSDKVEHLNDIKIIIKDSKGNQINSLKVLIDRDFDGKEEYKTSSSTDIALEDASKIEFEFEEEK